MKEVILTFPDISSLADFILEQNISNACVNTKEQELTAILSEDQIVVASTQYAADLRLTDTWL